MGSSRKLQGEIDRVLKKVQEGVDVFDRVWNKVYDTEDANQREKLEADLKKEIKKLQRYRDQIKTWIQSSEIKYNEPYRLALIDARKLIEREMERFKICKLETERKAFSKKGLGQQLRRDPKEKAKSETRDWLNNVIHLGSSIARHKAHIMKLELILRLMDNDELSPWLVDDVKDFIDDYVERNQVGASMNIEQRLQERLQATYQLPGIVPPTEETKRNSYEVGASMDNIEQRLQATSQSPKIAPLTEEKNQIESPPLIQDVEHLRIPLQNLNLATNNFSNEYVIAKGGFGLVYKAQNEHGTIALKKLDQRFGQGDREFMMEIAMLSAYTHKNLVSLVGFCDEGDEKILVYKHEINGSLDKHLHKKDLTWIQRLQICLDVAQGLKYLHNDIGAQHRILHRDMKSSNILLDENFRAKISDFGLSKIALANVPCSALISKVCGTPGYVDPEYYKHGILTQKSDVYSFGVVMFEVLCGKLVGVSKHLDEPFSAELPQNCYEEGTLDEMIDSDLRNQMNSASLSTFSAIANQCLKCRGRDRPTMSVVVEELKKALVYQQVVSPE
ncbi:hypothetical protein L2E82_08689 [Cichorium intybus]|uniref:Uncharacterized protein n=1 Tax=Cichorium intybus TaxID=13427 RepID=A0ACB9G6K7_CICIN|nr:hypothetical protein L2E82_08689 [Cichorium intybus]